MRGSGTELTVSGLVTSLPGVYRWPVLLLNTVLSVPTTPALTHVCACCLQTVLPLNAQLSPTVHSLTQASSCLDCIPYLIFSHNTMCAQCLSVHLSCLCICVSVSRKNSVTVPLTNREGPFGPGGRVGEEGGAGWRSWPNGAVT